MTQSEQVIAQADAAIAALHGKGEAAVQLLIESLDRICVSACPDVAFIASSLSGPHRVMILRLARQRLAEIAVEAARERDLRG